MNDPTKIDNYCEHESDNYEYVKTGIGTLRWKEGGKYVLLPDEHLIEKRCKKCGSKFE